MKEVKNENDEELNKSNDSGLNMKSNKRKRFDGPKSQEPALNKKYIASSGP